MNDPAFLFYSSDFLVGTMFMNDEQVGKYIKLICTQHQRGHLSEKDMLKICTTYDEDVFSKFKKDENDLYYNERLESEINKRKAYSESRRNNRLSSNTKEKKGKKDMSNISKTYDKHMENENINIIINYLNNKLNSNYKSNTTKTRDLIIARFNNGYKVEDFKKVIDIKYKEWNKEPKKGQQDMRPYLRPSTLFGTKFEEYLNQKEVGKNQAEEDFLKDD